jgi:hypothetical protein
MKASIFLRNTCFYILLTVILGSCAGPPQRDCSAFKTGKYTFVAINDTDTLVSTFERFETIEIDQFQGKIDTSTVKWINDCEFILRNINPTSNSEKQAIHIKILETDIEGYRFEYGRLSDPVKLKGYAKKLTN